MLAFESGAMGTVDRFFCIADESSQNVLELYGSEGSILAEGTIGQGSQGEMVFYPRAQSQGYDAQQVRDTGGRVADIAVDVPVQNLNQGLSTWHHSWFSRQ